RERAREWEHTAMGRAYSSLYVCSRPWLDTSERRQPSARCQSTNAVMITPPSPPPPPPPTQWLRGCWQGVGSGWGRLRGGWNGGIGRNRALSVPVPGHKGLHGWFRAVRSDRSARI